MRPLLFVALDNLTVDYHETINIAGELASVEGNFGFKVNLDYLLIRGIKEALKPVQQFCRPVFTDLKMWNGTRTMRAVIEELVAQGVDYLNVYALADDQLVEAVSVAKGTNTKVLAVTVLTHYDDNYCRRHFKRSLRDTVRHCSKVGIKAGCDGVILPGTTLDAVADFDTEKAVPGVRPLWYKDSRHSEEIEPGMAVKNGGKILVCGSPIIKSREPKRALMRVLDEMLTA